MKHPTQESLKPLLNAVDTAVWALAIKNQTRTGTKCRVDWKSALQDLTEAWHMYQLTHDDLVLVTSEPRPSASDAASGEGKETT